MRVTARNICLIVTVVVMSATGCQLPGNVEMQPPEGAAGATQGGKLRVALMTPHGVDPIDAHETSSSLIVSTMCDTLVSVDPLSGKVVPALARDWVVSPDGTTITFKLHHDALFSDGSPVTANAVAASLARLASASNASHVADLLTPIIGSDKLRKSLLEEADKPLLEGAQAINRYDLQITTAGADGDYLRAFAQPATAPVSLAATNDRQAFARQPVCSGPYKLASPYGRGKNALKLVRVSNYSANNIGYSRGGSGYANEIEFVFYKKAIEAVKAYDQGHVHVAPVPGTSLRARKLDMTSGPTLTEEYVGLPNGHDGPFAVPALRQALSASIDRRALLDKVFGAAAEPATGFIPPGLASMSPCSWAPVGGDPELARKALAEAEPALVQRNILLKQTPLLIHVNDDGVYPRLAAEIAAHWRRVLGLNVAVKAEPWQSYIGTATRGAGFDGPFRLSWSAEAASPSVTYDSLASFLGPLIRSTETATGNLAHFGNPGIEDDLRQASKLVVAESAVKYSPLTRLQAFQRISEKLCREMPIIPLGIRRATWLIQTSAWGSGRSRYLSTGGHLLLREMHAN